jgi:hypothetical protein
MNPGRLIAGARYRRAVFLAHVAVAFASKPLAPRTSLGVLTAAALLPDLVWPILLLTGVEDVEIDPGNTAFSPLAFVNYPFSHSLLATAMWGALVASAYFTVRGYRRGALIAGAAALSHWFLDALAHRPDLPLYPGSTVYAGLGLWNSAPGTTSVELGLFFAGLLIYLRRCRAAGLAPWVFAAFLLVVFVANVVGPPPPSARAVAVVGLASWLLPVWAGFADRGRTARGS